MPAAHGGGEAPQEQPMREWPYGLVPAALFVYFAIYPEQVGQLPIQAIFFFR
jgi:hypothetical protein